MRGVFAPASKFIDGAPRLQQLFPNAPSGRATKVEKQRLCRSQWPLAQWRSQPKNLVGAKMLDFRRTAPFYLEKRLSKHKITIFSENLRGAWLLWAPLAAPTHWPLLRVRSWTRNVINWGRRNVNRAAPELQTRQYRAHIGYAVDLCKTVPKIYSLPFWRKYNNCNQCQKRWVLFMLQR